ncbi:MAG: DUF4430 domain-containing protein [Baekduia sp.]
MSVRSTAVVAACAALLGAAGCGVGAGESAESVQLRVTDGFGERTLAQSADAETRGEDTIMRVLQRGAPDVKTRFGGGFVQSIAGRSGSTGGRRLDWFFYVNGYISDKGAAQVKVRSGDRIWWDRHDWSVTDRIWAVVGSFPEPFIHGYDGNRHPVRIECGTDEDTCKDVQSRFTGYDIVAGLGNVSRSFTKQTLRVLVGPWPALDGDSVARTIALGPKESGVFARISPDGKTITTLDERGRTVRTLGPGTGLIAATAPEGVEQVQSGPVRKDPVWVVTGTDDAGVRAAVDAFDEGALAGAFAVVVTGGQPVPLPERR